MSPKKINKEDKRKAIALDCLDLFHEVGIRKITVSQVAESAGIGKGTVYEYFENKEDIVFEIINIHIEQYHEEFLKSIKNVRTTKEKVVHFFKFVTDNSEENLKHINGYKEYISIVLSEDNEEMMKFNSTCHNFFEIQLNKIIEDGIKNGELKEEARSFVKALLVYEKGLFLLKVTQKEIDVEKECSIFLENFFRLLEKNKG